MRTTLDIDRHLLDRAKAAMGVRTYTEAIERSLEAALARTELSTLLDALGDEDLVWSVEELRAFRHADRGERS